jgi:hypothetical protein
VLGKGDRDSMYAFAFTIGQSGDTIPLTNVDFAWSAGDPNVARVEGASGGAAEITALNYGKTKISARPTAFEQANSGDTTLRVAQGFVIDSIKPAFVKFGQKVTVYGVGVGNIAFLDLGFADLIRDEFSFQGSPDGLAQESYWVPYPAFTDAPFYGIFGGGQFVLGNFPDTVHVDTLDLYEPDTIPPILDINGAGGPRAVATLPALYYNPALFYEPTTTGFFNTDFQRFDRAANDTVSLFVNSFVYGDTAFPFIGDSIYWDSNFQDYFPGPGSWFFTAGRQECNGSQFYYFTQPRVPSYVVSFMKWPTSRLYFLQFYTKAGRYEMTAAHGAYLPDPRVQPDRFEDDGLCWQADSNFADSVGPNRKRILVGIIPPFGAGPFRDSTLTISTPFETDFYRIRVQQFSPGDTNFTIQTKSLPFGGTDPSDIDVYVFDPATGSNLNYSANVGSAEQITMRLDAGEYYVVVTDVAGQPTRYSICIVKGLGCVPPGTAPPARVTAKAHTWVTPAMTAAALARPSNSTTIPRGLRPHR